MNLATLTEQSRHYLRHCNLGGLPLPGLIVLQRDEVSEIEAVVYEPVICLILQGRKESSIGDQFVDLGPGDALLVSHDLPVLSRITLASPHEPYLAIILALDLAMVRGLYDQLPDGLAPNTGSRSLAAEPADPAWLAPLERYLALADNPVDARVLGPAILREIHYRLLVSPSGGMLRHLLATNSHASRIARAIQLLRRNYRSCLSMPDLAGSAGMSVTTFHQHFKAVTGTTPLQYQKDLRLIEARNLLTEHGQSVSEVAFTVGYESPTHFSRDYKRRFSLAPSRDTKNLVAKAR